MLFWPVFNPKRPFRDIISRNQRPFSFCYHLFLQNHFSFPICLSHSETGNKYPLVVNEMFCAGFGCLKYIPRVSYSPILK